MTKRRDLIKNTTQGTTGIAIGGIGMNPKAYDSIIGANERINVAVIGIRNQGNVHIDRWCNLRESHNVRIKTICDPDERLFESRSRTIMDKTGDKPLTEWDLRRVFDDRDITAVSIVTPNHWHALATIWACQAGKHVYVEKPVCHNIFEGRKMVEAGIKYKMHIQHGSSVAAGEAMDFLHSGGIGKIYMVRGLCLHRRDSYGMSE
ncbi:MAG TPA: gfo/Idh/MocA family oxidoreductase, partial [Bacteroidales bacterium]|nr:gfo/Idh/MocA family oxidoreductase [Bacteroidales bacterium]